MKWKMMEQKAGQNEVEDDGAEGWAEMKWKMMEQKAGQK